jgi:type 1 glutamine amidotransferase
MKHLHRAVLFCACLAPLVPAHARAAEPAAGTRAASCSFTPGEPWLDTDGRPIDAHAAGILLKDGVYYWYGESHARGAGNKTGVTVYSSRDLCHWKNGGVALPKQALPEKFRDGGVCERPKVIWNARGGRYVMWMHLDADDYAVAAAGVAVADSPTGPFRFVSQSRPIRYDYGYPAGDRTRQHELGNTFRDMNLFVDDDGAAYVFYASEDNATTYVARLNADYTAIEQPAVEGKTWARVLPGAFREASAPFKHAGRYYMFTSGTTGWAPNPADLAVADRILGPWQRLGNPFTGSGAETSFRSQSTYVLPAPGRPHGDFIYLGDRWNGNALEKSSYVWLPFRMGPDGTTSLVGRDRWDFSFFDTPQAAIPKAAAAELPDVRVRFFQPGKLRALVLSGRNNHDWRSTTPFLRQLLVDSGRFDVRVVLEPDGISARTLAPYDLVLSDYCGPRWGAATEQALVEFVRGGKGLVVVHGAAFGFSGLDVLADRHVKTGIVEPAWTEHGQMVGGYWPAPPAEQFHGARHSFSVRLVDREHPVTRGFPEHFIATDELYHRMTLTPSAHVLATAYSDPATGGTGRDEPILWLNEWGKGRVYFTALGHEVAAMQNDRFKSALLRGAEWAATGAVTLPVDAGALKERPEALRVLVVTGGHDFPTSFYTLFEGRPEWRWSHAVTNEAAFAEDVVTRYDVIVFYDMPRTLSAPAQARLKAFAEAGKGIVALHHSLFAYPDWPFWEELLGGRYFVEDRDGVKASTYRHDVELFVKTAGSHPIVDPIGPLHLVDETYKGARLSPRITPLLEVAHPDADRWVAWVSPYASSRVVCIQPGHDERAHRSAAYRQLVRNAVLWSAGRLP